LITGNVDFEVDFAWHIHFDASVEPSFELGKKVLATVADVGGQLAGENLIETGATTGSISLQLAKSNKKAEAEVAWLELDTCTMKLSSDASCNVDATRSIVRIEIVKSLNQKQTSEEEGQMPVWVWYPIAAGILLLAALGAFGYMYYNKRKVAEEQLQQREADLANAEELDNLDNFGALGDNVTFNPIATAGTQDVATGGEYIDKQLAKQQKNAEFAQVDVDKEVWRQDFGQVKADRHNTEV
jgi:hypothetical protein